MNWKERLRLGLPLPPISGGTASSTVNASTEAFLLQGTTIAVNTFGALDMFGGGNGALLRNYDMVDGYSWLSPTGFLNSTPWWNRLGVVVWRIDNPNPLGGKQIGDTTNALPLSSPASWEDGWDSNYASLAAVGVTILQTLVVSPVITSTATLTTLIARIGIPWNMDWALPPLLAINNLYRGAVYQAILASDVAWRKANTYLSLVVTAVSSVATLVTAVARIGIPWAYDQTLPLRQGLYIVRQGIDQAVQASDIAWRKANTYISLIVSPVVSATASLASVVNKLIPWAYDQAVPYLKNLPSIYRVAVDQAIAASIVEWRKANTYLTLVANAVTSAATLATLIFRIGIAWAYDSTLPLYLEGKYVIKQAIDQAVVASDVSWRKANTYLSLTASVVSSLATLTTTVFRIGIAWAYDQVIPFFIQGGKVIRGAVDLAMASSSIEWRVGGVQFLKTLTATVVSSTATLATAIFRIGIPWVYDQTLPLRQALYTVKEAIRQSAVPEDISWRKANTYLTLVASTVASAASLVVSIFRIGIAWAYDSTLPLYLEGKYIVRNAVDLAIQASDVAWRKANTYLTLVSNAVSSLVSLVILSGAFLPIAWAYDQAMPFFIQGGKVIRQSIDLAIAASNLEWFRLFVIDVIAAGATIAKRVFGRSADPIADKPPAGKKGDQVL